MRKVRFLLSILFVCLLSIDGMCEGDSLKFVINEKVISFKKDEMDLKLTSTLTNSSRTNLLLYAFRKTIVLDYSADSIFFNDIINSGGAGSVLIILDKNKSRKEIHRIICFDCGAKNFEYSHSPDYLSQVIKKAKDIYIETAEVVNVMGPKKIKLSISMEGINLDKGEYYIYMIYYCGSEIHDVVGRDIVQEDEEKFKAQILRGWVRSDTVKLIVD